MEQDGGSTQQWWRSHPSNGIIDNHSSRGEKGDASWVQRKARRRGRFRRKFFTGIFVSRRVAFHRGMGLVARIARNDRKIKGAGQSKRSESVASAAGIVAACDPSRKVVSSRKSIERIAVPWAFARDILLLSLFGLRCVRMKPRNRFHFANNNIVVGFFVFRRKIGRW